MILSKIRMRLLLSIVVIGMVCGLTAVYYYNQVEQLPVIVDKEHYVSTTGLCNAGTSSCARIVHDHYVIRLSTGRTVHVSEGNYNNKYNIGDIYDGDY